MPVMSIVDRLEQAARAGGIPVRALGGVDAILAEADGVAESPFLDILVASAAEASPDDRTRLAPLLIQAFAVNRHPSTYRDALEILLGGDVLLQAMLAQLVPVLAGRVTDRRTNPQALIAAYALEALFQISLDHAPTRYRVLMIMSELSDQESDLFAEHAAKLVGAAYHQWGEAPLLDTLAALQTIDGAAGEAAYELAMAALARALDAAAMDQIREGLRSAHELFAVALTADPGRLDAHAYCAIIDILELFASNGAAIDLDAPLLALEQALDDRHELLGIGRIPLWLRPRCDREIEWCRLLTTVRRAAQDLERPSWLHAAKILEQILSLYEAERTVAMGRGLHQIFVPRIEASFVRERGLVAHLDDLLAVEDWDPSLRVTADRLRSSIARAEASLPRIVEENARFPLLQGVLPDEEAALVPAKMAATLEALLADRATQPRRIANPIVHRVYRRLSTELSHCPDYEGNIKDSFDDLLLQVIMFCVDRQDGDKRTQGTRIEYLRRKDATEQDLQLDLREFLRGNLLSADVLAEIPGVAIGRTDLYVIFSNCRVIIELKKHEGVADAQAAKRYRSQAASYQATNVRLGFLGMLELLDRPGPAASLEECLWIETFIPTGASMPRYLVAFRVPGMLKPPSSFS
jgi:hypothetical protein